MSQEIDQHDAQLPNNEADIQWWLMEIVEVLREIRDVMKSKSIKDTKDTKIIPVVL